MEHCRDRNFYFSNLILDKKINNENNINSIYITNTHRVHSAYILMFIIYILFFGI